MVTVSTDEELNYPLSFIVQLSATKEPRYRRVSRVYRRLEVARKSGRYDEARVDKAGLVIVCLSDTLVEDN